MKKSLQTILFCIGLLPAFAQNSFTPGNIVVLQTSGTASKASSAVTLKEFTTSGVAGMSVSVPATGPTPFQSAGVFGGSEGFLTTSDDGKFLVVGGYATSATIADITATSASSTNRAVGIIYPSGFYLQYDTSGTFFSANDIRGAVSDGTNFWASGASNALIDGIDYFGPGAKIALATGATPPKAYGMRIFGGQLYYSTQKSGPSNSSSQLGIFALGTGLPTSGTPAVTQIINTGTVIPEDFSFNAAGNICYIAVNLNTSAGGIQKWTKSGSVWSLAYTLGTGIANTGAYGLVVDYSGTNPTIYATTFDATGNRVIKIVDNGASATATTLVAAASNVYYKGIAFAPVASGTPLVNLSVSSDTASEGAASVITVTANASAPVTGNQTVSIAVSGTGITSGDYTLSNATITIPNGMTSGSVTFTVVDDILGEGTEKAKLTMSAPTSGITLGMRTQQTITIADNDGNNKPTIALDTSTTNFIDGGVSSSPASPFKLSGVINDPTDPASTSGVNFLVKDLETPSTSLTAWTVSSNITVVPNANVTITGTDSIRVVKIMPIAVGYSDITIKVTDGIDTSSYIVNYAASAASATPSATVWHTGMSDASDAVALGDNYYVSGDDELNVLNVYSRNSSGLPLVSYNYTSFLALPDPAKPEVDIEASAVSGSNPNKIYWLGSMSNGKAPFDNKPNRDRIFAVTYSGTGAATAFTFGGYASLRSSLLTWGDANGYSFSASAAMGVDSKSPSGFAAEGMVFGPDNTTLYVGLRAPLVPTSTRTKAVIAPITNFESWFNNGAPSGSPSYGSPIELDLGGRGIRDIIRLSNGSYVIIAGNPAGSPLTSAIYKWTGFAGDAPILVPSSVSGVLNMEGVMPIKSGSVLSLSSLQVITDQGDDIFYNDGVVAKDFGDLIYRKFRSDIVSSIDLSYPEIDVQGNSVSIVDGDTTPSVTDSTDFTNVTYGSPESRTFVIRNLGTAALNVSNIYFTGTNAADFSLVSAPVFPLSVAANSSQIVTVQFAPGNVGARSATMNIASDDNDESTYDFSLLGTGVCNVLTIDTVSGGGTMCFGDPGFNVGMKNTRAGYKYQLYNGTSMVGSPVQGTNAPVNFGTETAAGNYTVIATDTVTGCTTTMAGVAVIVVNPLPATIAGTLSVCKGLSTSLSNSSTGGTWFSANTTVAAITGTGVTTGLAVGTSDITYTLPTGCMISSVVTVNPLPAAITGTATVCHGLTTTLSDAGGGSWNSANAGIAIVGLTSGIVTGMSPGSTTITYTLPVTGCIATTVVTVNPLPATILGPTAVCEGAVTTLSDASGGTWSSSNTAVAAIDMFSGVLSGITAGTATITFKLPTGCLGTRLFTVDQMPSSVTGSSSVCQGLSTLFSNGLVGGSWTSGNTTVATVDMSSGLVSGISAGTSAITYAMPTGCMVSASITVNPASAPITGANKVCKGLTVTLSDASAGMWSSSNTAIATVGSGSGVVKGVTAGTLQILYTLPTGCFTTYAFTVNPTPNVYNVTGGGDYCAGGSGVHVGLSYSDLGIDYHLYKGPVMLGLPFTGISSSIDFGFQTGAGTYKVVATNSATGCVSNMSGSALVTVTSLVKPAVAIISTLPDTICIGTRDTFTVMPVNSGSSPYYEWTLNGVSLGFHGTKYIYTPSEGDELVVSMLSNAYCVVTPSLANDSKVLHTAQIYIPTVAITAEPSNYIAKGQSVKFTATVTEGGPSPKYQWLKNKVPVPGATSAIFTTNKLANKDSVSCLVIGSGVCGMPTFNSILMNVNTTGIGEVAGGIEAVLYPDPNAGTFTIEGTVASGSGDEVRIDVSDMLGRSVYSSKAITSDGNIKERVQLSNNLASGTYLLTLHAGAERKVFRFVMSK